MKAHKKAEKLILDLLNQNQDGNFISLPNKFSHIDLAGTINGRKIAVEVKERLTGRNYGDGPEGWSIEHSKVMGMSNQLVEMGQNPKDIEMYYCNIWNGNIYLFDVKSVKNKKYKMHRMNKQTYFSNTDKVEKKVYYFRNDECILNNSNIKINELWRV